MKKKKRRKYAHLTINFGEQTGTCVFPLVIAVHSFLVSVFVVSTTTKQIISRYEQDANG